MTTLCDYDAIGSPKDRFISVKSAKMAEIV